MSNTGDNIVQQLRRRAQAVYLAAEAGPADDLSRIMREAAARIEELEAELERLADAPGNAAKGGGLA